MSRFTTLRGVPLSTWAPLGVLVVITLAVAVGPAVLPHGAEEIVGDLWEPMSSAHPLGTDQLGRDMLARVLEGGRTSLSLAAVIAVLAFLLGSGAGLTAAFLGGWVDTALSRAVDLLMAFPPLIFALLTIAVLGNSIPVLVTVLTLFEALRIFRLTRSLAMEIAVQEFVAVARLRGEGIGWILFREILPNSMVPLMAELAIRFVFGLLFLSSLSFLGLGVPPPAPDWGGMVRDNAPAISFGLSAPLVPAAMIAVVAVCVNLVADSLLHTRGRSRSAEG